MQAKDHVDLGRIEDTSLTQCISTGAAFFCRLKNQFDPTSEMLAETRKNHGTAKQICHMSVMTTGMHDSVAFGSITAAGRFSYRQSIHIGPQRHGWSRRHALNQADYAELGYPLSNLYTLDIA